MVAEKMMRENVGEKWAREQVARRDDEEEVFEGFRGFCVCELFVSVLKSYVNDLVRNF
jgi:hypothetical protein